MVVTTQKDLSEILEAMGRGSSWVIIGCADCAAVCRTGGSAQVEEMTQRLEERGKQVLATVSLPSPCDRRLSRRDLKRVESELEQADGVLCLACGGGVQSVASVVDRPVIAGLDAHFVGTVERLGLFHEECALCGECVLNQTGGLCPVALCPKELRNGPCEGSRQGRCDVDAEVECVWEKIYSRLENTGRLEDLTTFRPAVDGSRWGRPRTTRPTGEPEARGGTR